MTDPGVRISVLVPVHNDARNLPVAIDSILAQTHAKLEVIVSDDASSDGSADAARSYAARDPRIRLVVQPTNRGMTGNWNAALQHATGEYVCKLDSDDFWRPRVLEHLLAAHQCEPRPIAAFCRTLQCDECLEPIASYPGDIAMIRRRIDPLVAQVRRGHDWYRMAFDDFQLWHSNAFLIRTEALRELGGWDEHYGCASDTDLILRLLEKNEPVVHVPYAGVLYRQRPGSISSEYRRSALLTLESSIVHLRSLQRFHASSGRLDRGLVFAWQRYREIYDVSRGWLDEPERWSRAEARALLRAAGDGIASPPPIVRIRGALDRLRRRMLAVLAPLRSAAAGLGRR